MADNSATPAPPDFSGAFKSVTDSQGTVETASAAVHKKEAEIDVLALELEGLETNAETNLKSYKTAVSDLKSIVDAEHTRLNTPAS